MERNEGRFIARGNPSEEEKDLTLTDTGIMETRMGILCLRNKFPCNFSEHLITAFRERFVG